MRVAHLTEALAGGVLAYMRTVLPSLVCQGYQVSLICSLNRPWPGLQGEVQWLRDAGVSVHVVPMSRGMNLLADSLALAKVYRILLGGKFNILHTHSSKGGGIGRIAALMAGIKVVVHSPHCFAFLRCDGSLQRQMYLRMERLLGRLTTKIAAVSRDEAKVAVSSGIVSAAGCERIDNGLDDLPGNDCRSSRKQRSVLKRALDIEPEATVVTTVCRLVKYKGIYSFLEAAEASRSQDVVFLVAGEGELKPALQQWIRRRKLTRKVRLLGHVDAMEDLYAATDLVVLCPQAEGLSYVVLEAMRMGIPIVATAVPGNLGVIAHRITGYLVPHDARKIAAVIDHLLANECLRREYGRNAYAYFREHHRLCNQVNALTRLYSQCCATRGAS